MTVLESLKLINPYPIPSKTVEKIALKRGLSSTPTVDQAVLLSGSYRLCEADLYIYLSKAPDVTQEGITYRFTDEDKRRFINIANGIYKEEGEDGEVTGGVTYGYKGTNL